MAQVWLEQGYRVDVIDYRNAAFVPKKNYAFFVSARTHLATLAPRLNRDCVKIAHFDTSHYVTNNAASYQRLLDAQRRRRVSLPDSARLIEHNLALEVADYGVVLGNQNTVDTYRYASKPLFSLCAPTVVDLPWDDAKDFATVRNNFVWFGSAGLVHKGLDLVLEAFADMPEANLTVCGPIQAEAAFCSAYQKELREKKNIHVEGWVDVHGETFRDIVSRCGAIVYPSCAEGQATSVLNCMRTGLVPIVTKEAGFSVQDFGLLLQDLTVESIQRTVKQLMTVSASDFAERARKTWEYTRAQHSHEAYTRRYHEIVQSIRAEHRISP